MHVIVIMSVVRVRVVMIVIMHMVVRVIVRMSGAVNVVQVTRVVLDQAVVHMLAFRHQRQGRCA